MSWGMNVSGFSGLSAASTGPYGTGASEATPATGADGGVMQGVQSLGATCGVCQHPAVKQGLFFVAFLLLWVCWHTHLHSMMD